MSYIMLPLFITYEYWYMLDRISCVSAMMIFLSLILDHLLMFHDLNRKHRKECLEDLLHVINLQEHSLIITLLMHLKA